MAFYTIQQQWINLHDKVNKKVNVSLLIARRILKKDRVSRSPVRPVVAFAVSGIALGLAAMLISVMVVTGFQSQISRKVSGFMSHIRISPFSSNESFEEEPARMSPALRQEIASVPGVKSLSAYAHKACIMKAGGEINGIVLKGYDKEYDVDFLRKNLTEGVLPEYSDQLSDQVILSSSLAKKMNLKAGDSFLVFFIQEDRKIRKLKVAGLYHTGLLEEFDQLYVFCDLNLIRSVNDWSADESAGWEVRLQSDELLTEAEPLIYSLTGYQYDTRSIRELYPQIYNWLDLQNLNVIIILSLISLVAGATMISTLLILILENSRTIGLLKSLGGSNKQVQKTFLYIAFFILLRGMVLGNLIAYAFGFIQSKTGFLKLDESNYYLDRVPVNLMLHHFFLINGICLLVCFLFLLIPVRIISRISPVRVLRFR